ncbi:MAG: hypothetical protein J6Z40_06110 [Oscillospiraceae bacterium]|nr:hypothetical protein [Oscillospiraceae bacterium]MBQ5338724.1 hypothetical protein [Oscillospiraceae bacterium]
MKIELTEGCYFREGKYFSKHFDKELAVYADLDESMTEEYVGRCADAVEHFSDEMTDTINEAAKRYALDTIAGYMEDEGEDFSFEEYDLPEITEDTPAGDMPEYFRFKELIVNKPKQEGQLYFRLCGGCDWENEHGFEAAFQDGTLVYLGAFCEAVPGRLDYFVSGKGREFNYAIKGE